jgi:hypothetical protein
VTYILKIVDVKLYLITRLCSIAVIIEGGFCVANGRAVPWGMSAEHNGGHSDGWTEP